MTYPKIDLREREVILLSGFRRIDEHVVIMDQAELQAAAERHRDAVAFGYVAGRWVPAA